jgi:hypothetical protein
MNIVAKRMKILIRWVKMFGQTKMVKIILLQENQANLTEFYDTL